MVSINTNSGLNTALRNFNSITANLERTGDRISTGYKVIGPKDDASNFAVAQGTRADLKSLQAVDQSLSAAVGLITTVVGAGVRTSEVNADVKKKIVELANPANTVNQTAILRQDLLDLLDGAQSVRLEAATYNGRNQFVTGATPVDFVATVDGDTIQVPTFSVGDTFNPLRAAVVAATTQADFIGLFPLFDAFDLDVSQNLGSFGSIHKQVIGMKEQNKALADALTEGLGSMVDADLAKESARFQAQQTQQQLSSQSLSVATSFINVIRGLFA